MKIALISFTTCSKHLNYGAVLHGYALQRYLARMGAEPVARSANRNLLVETHRHPDGRATVFVSNLHASPQTTRLTLYRDGRPAAERDLSLAPMQVAVSDFP